MRYLSTGWGVLVAFSAARVAAGAAQGPLEDALVKAAAYVSSCEERLSLVRATEKYEQRLFESWTKPQDDAPRRAADGRKSARTILSEVLWVPSEDAVVMAFYRDVWSVDGKPTRDRSERLSRLFRDGPSETARSRAVEILDESARFNLGMARRNTNIPTLALSFLHARNQPRFRFALKGTSRLGARRVVEIEFREVAHPTLTRNQTGQDVAARGSAWIATDDGAILKTDLRFDKVSARVKVTFEREPRLEIFVPSEMRDLYRSDALESIEGVATYSEYRRGQAEVGPIVFR